MSIIILDDEYAVESDTYCWILKSRKATGTISDKAGSTNFGKEIIRENVTYHGSLKQALTVYLDESLRDSSTVREVVERITDAIKRIEALDLPRLARQTK
jgi:hypothetical protein